MINSTEDTGVNMGLASFLKTRAIRLLVEKWFDRVVGLTEYYSETDPSSERIAIFAEVLEGFMENVTGGTYKIDSSTGGVQYVFPQFIYMVVCDELAAKSYSYSAEEGMIIKIYEDRMRKYIENPLKGANSRRRVAESLIRAGSHRSTPAQK